MRTGLQENEEEKPAWTSSPVLPPSVITPIEVAETVVQQAEEDLGQLEPTDFGFSEPAFHELKRNIGAYIKDLVTASSREAKRQQADVVSKSHVERAAQSLVTGTESRNARRMGIIGGFWRVQESVSFYQWCRPEASLWFL